MSTQRPIIVWFRQDLRLSDNPAFAAASRLETAAPILPIYILDDENAGEWCLGGASRWWLHESLSCLNKSLDGLMHFFSGPADKVLKRIVEAVDAQAVFWNRCYEPWRIERDKKIKASLSNQAVDARSFNGSLLIEPPKVSKSDGSAYRVYTPYYRAANIAELKPLEAQAQDYKLFADEVAGSCSLGELDLLPEINWYQEMASAWEPGEAGADRCLETFLDTGLRGYKDGRDRPDQEHVSRLSPHLHFGEISVGQVKRAAELHGAVVGLEEHVDKFVKELGWREFSNYLLYHWPSLPSENFQPKFDAFEWQDSKDALQRWQRGITGYPIVDAGMRELWRTGYMHNRVRMIVASFLVKNLLVHWRHGAAWFWDTLVDADLANNSASWQWVAGSGADAAPYFRIFNPVTQGQKFDPNGDYVRKYVPELSELPNKYVQCPWDAPPLILESAGVTLGQNYPEPMVDLKASRQKALDLFARLSR